MTDRRARILTVRRQAPSRPVSRRAVNSPLANCNRSADAMRATTMVADRIREFATVDAVTPNRRHRRGHPPPNPPAIKAKKIFD